MKILQKHRNIEIRKSKNTKHGCTEDENLPVEAPTPERAHLDKKHSGDGKLVLKTSSMAKSRPPIGAPNAAAIPAAAPAETKFLPSSVLWNLCSVLIQAFLSVALQNLLNQGTQEESVLVWNCEREAPMRLPSLDHSSVIYLRE